LASAKFAILRALMPRHRAERAGLDNPMVFL
jgi:hypothetical protein